MATIDPRLLGERRQGPDRKLTPQQELEAIRDYSAGMKIADIREKHGITKPTLYLILKRHGLTTAKPTKPQEPPAAPESAA